MTEPRRYRKKPVIVEAMKYDGTNRTDILYWVGRRYEGDPFERDGFIAVEEQWPDPPVDVTALIWDKLHDTWVGVKDGQWIIKGVQGEFYPCDPDVFAATYAEEGTAWPTETDSPSVPFAPKVAPLVIDVGPESVQEVWDTFVKPDQISDKPQSAEMRVLMAILRAAYVSVGGK